MAMRVMTLDLRRLIEHAAARQALRSPLLVYGAGGKGRRTIDFLASQGLDVEAVLDVSATPGQTCEGRPVHAPASWVHSHVAHKYDAVVAIHNPQADIATLIAQLRGFGFRRVVAPVELHQIFGESLARDYFLAPAEFYRDKLDDIARARDLLCDATSGVWYERALEFRIGGDYAVLPSPSPGDQYRPRDVPRWTDPMRLVDCGAYDGDTLRHLAAGGYRIEALAAFEADLANFRCLQDEETLPQESRLFPCAVGERAQTVRFASGTGASSRVDPGGDTFVSCVRLDQTIPDFRPTLIKMDVEGGESGALAGGTQLVARDRPGLAISAYHHPADLWSIALLIDSWKLGYRLYLRGHAHSTFDLVLYAQAA
jgi:FkbM family methyltransferase